MKLCVDCKHYYREVNEEGTTHLCARMREIECTSLVTGLTTEKGQYLCCEHERGKKGILLYDSLCVRCGPEGKYFKEND